MGITEVVETTDLETAEEVFGGQYTAMRMRSHGGPSLFRHSNTSLGRVRLDRTTFQMSMEGSADPLSSFLVVRCTRGRVGYTYGGAEERYGAGDIFVPVPPDRPWDVTLDDFDGQVLVLDRSVLDDAAGREPDEPALELHAGRPHSAALGESLWRLADAVEATFIRQPELVAAPDAADAAARMLAASVLNALTHNACVEATRAYRRDAGPISLRRAIAYIDSHADHPVTLKDIAEAACTTQRAVQLAFRRHLDTTPLGYLRRVRLEQAHRALQAADPASTTVMAIATRWGFTNAGHFAGLYRSTFGCLPSSTLHDAVPRPPGTGWLR